MTTFLTALFLATTIIREAPPQVLIQPVIPETAPPGPPPEVFQVQDDASATEIVPNFQTQVEQNYASAQQIQQEAAFGQRAEMSRTQRLRLYDLALQRLGDIDAALVAGEGHQEDNLGEVRAVVSAIRSTRPGPIGETSNLAIGSTALANAEVASRRSNDQQVRQEISRARQVLSEARAQAQSRAAR